MLLVVTDMHHVILNSFVDVFELVPINGQIFDWEHLSTAFVTYLGDLFVIAFGMNDPVTSEADYKASIKQMINAYYAVNPNGSVLLVSPMLPNTQSKMICGNQTLWENALNSVKNSTEYRGKNISLAKVYTIYSELVSISGKLPRDYLGNNVNHPTDFGVRIYAQVVLKTLCGDDFYF